MARGDGVALVHVPFLGVSSLDSGRREAAKLSAVFFLWAVKYRMEPAVTVPGRDIVSLLHYEAKRRSKVAELVERAATLTDEEIAAADVPLPWYRKALTLVRDRARAEAMARSFDNGGSCAHLITDGRVEDPTGEIREYLGETVWVRSGSSLVEVPYGKWLFFLHTGGIWADTALCENDARLYHGSRLIEVGTKNRYRVARQEHLLRLHSDAPIIFSETPAAGSTAPGAAQTRLGALGVRFSR